MEITTELIEAIDNEGKDLPEEPERIPVEYFLNEAGERFYYGKQGETIKTSKTPETGDILHKDDDTEYFFSPSNQWVEKTKKVS